MTVGTLKNEFRLVSKGEAGFGGIGEILSGALFVSSCDTPYTPSVEPAAITRGDAITDLSSYEMAVLHPIPITITLSGGDFLASFEAANVNASGESDAEAVENLKAMIADKFSFLRTQESLGGRLRISLDVLRSFVAPKA